ncbi:MAG: ribonuclease R [Culicoidibacterales bacterium]
MKIKDSILSYFKTSESPLQIDRVTLATKLSVEHKDYQLLFKALNMLEKDMELRRLDNGDYTLFDNNLYSNGVVHTHRKGFGFVTIEGEEEDLFINPNDLNGALDGDSVLVQKIKDLQHPDKFAAKVIKVTGHADRTLVGEIQPFNAQYFRMRTDSSNYLGEIFIVKADYPALVVGQKVVVKPNKFLLTGKIVAKVEEVIGHHTDPGVDILSIVKKFNVETEFSKEIYEELEAIPRSVQHNEISERIDLRTRQIVTIDGADAKDLDDAISLTTLPNGNYQLGVHIADVSHYVKKAGAIDQTALLRGTSVYLADRVIPMLPHQLSNGICSLNPEVDRLTLTCDMEINAEGVVITTDVYQSIIHSNARMTYADVNTLLVKADNELALKYKAFLPLFFEMEKCAAILGQKRSQRGALDFELNEAKIIVDENGTAIDVVLRNRGTAEKIIEQFMIEANETVAKIFVEKAWPFIYRVHATPKESKLDIFRQVAGNLGVNVAKIRDNKEIAPKVLQQLLADISDKPEHGLLATLLLRTMQKAEYAPDNIGHFGLSAINYTHFTSPIRRYPDLIVHRMIRKFIIEDNIDETEFSALKAELKDIAKHTSKTERVAIECEREVASMKMAEYMESKIGTKFTGIISGVTNSGIFVELDNMVEGHVAMETLTDDFYQYIPEHLMLLGRRKAKKFKMGDTIKVELTFASKKTSTIQFTVEGMEADNYSKANREYKQGVSRDRNKPARPYKPREATKENEAYTRRREEKGSSSPRRDDKSGNTTGGYNRGPRRDDRSGNTTGGYNRGPRRDDRSGNTTGGYNRGPRREEQSGNTTGEYNRGPRRDDRGGNTTGEYNRGPRRDDRGGNTTGEYNKGPRRDDRSDKTTGGYNRGPRRDDRGGNTTGEYNKGPRRDDRSDKTTNGYNKAPRSNDKSRETNSYNRTSNQDDKPKRPNTNQKPPYKPNK